jgi:hypothetical protein
VSQGKFAFSSKPVRLVIVRAQVEFTADAFPPYPGEEESINPGIWGKRLAEYIVAQLPVCGVEIVPGGLHAEDWGWELPLKNDAFPMFIGCGNQAEGGNRFLCFISPSEPEIRRGWFKKVSTVADVERIAYVLDQILRSHPEIKDLHWIEDGAL